MFNRVLYTKHPLITVLTAQNNFVVLSITLYLMCDQELYWLAYLHKRISRFTV